MKYFFALFLPLFLAAWAAAPAAHARPAEGEPPSGLQAPRSVQLGDITVDPDLKAYRIPVSNCGTNLSQLKIRVLGNSIFMKSILVVFQNRSTKSYDMNRSFDAGYESPWLDLGLFRPAGSCISQLVVTGQSNDDRVKAHVLVLGIMTQ